MHELSNAKGLKMIQPAGKLNWECGGASQPEINIETWRNRFLPSSEHVTALK
jgi:hypothetical protein